MKTFDQLMGFGPAKYLSHLSTHVCWGGGGGGGDSEAMSNSLSNSLSNSNSSSNSDSNSRTRIIESTPDWYRPYIQQSASGANEAYRAGDLSRVAGLNTQQRQGINALTTAANRADQQYMNSTGASGILGQAARGEGIYGGGATEALKAKAIRDAQGAWANGGGRAISSAGAIGGARGALLAQERDSSLASALAGIDYQDLADRRGISTGAAQQIIGNTGTLQQAGGAGADYQGKAGAVLQEQEQRELDSAYQGLQRLGSLLSGAPVPTQSGQQENQANSSSNSSSSSIANSISQSIANTRGGK